MNTHDRQIRRLVLWNRFWFVLVSLYALIRAYNYLWEYLTYDVERLHVSWNGTDDSPPQPALLLSMNQGGPFVVTHLIEQRVGDNYRASAVLPHPIVLYVLKSQAPIRLSEIDRLSWVDELGKKTSPPKLGDPVAVLYYVPRRISTKSQDDFPNY